MSRRFIFFTKTAWHEPPRLRHQLARLLVDDGDRVLFAERPGLWKTPPAGGSDVPSGITLFRHQELMHHKMRVSPLMRALNRAWTSPSIIESLRNFQPTREDVIVNFNYEYYFLRDLFPRNPLITVINDDFISRALPLCRESLHKAQRLTCRASDAVMTPSVVLQEQLRPYCNPNLFLPWADVPFKAPRADSDRDTILYWGFIDWRLDYAFLQSFAADMARDMPGVRLLFVGPTERGSDRHPLFSEHPNVSLLPPSKLDQLPLERVFASIIPFRAGVDGCDAIVMPNKAFQLLARGLPLLITGMPRFAEAPFIFRLDQPGAVGKVAAARASFASLQSSMQGFIADNDAAARLAQFRAIVEQAECGRKTAAV